MMTSQDSNAKAKTETIRSPVDANGTDLLSFAFNETVGQDGTKPIYIDAQDPDRCLNYDQTKTLTRKLIGGLKASGLQRGDCVLVVLPNNFLYSAIFFSIVGTGGVYLGVNPASQPFELTHALKLCKPKLIITSSDVHPTIVQAQALGDCKKPRGQFFLLDVKTFPLSLTRRVPTSPPPSLNGNLIEDERKIDTDFEFLAQYGESDWLHIGDRATAKSTPAAMFLTSGTSGLPKAAVCSHYTMVSQHTSLESHPPYDVRRLLSIPFFHLHAALFAHVYAVRLGQPLYILPKFEVDQFAHAVQRFQITDTAVAAPIIHALNNSVLPLSNLFRSIRWISVGGAPIALEAMQKFRTNLHQLAALNQNWGMTEIGTALMQHYPENDCDGSVGRPLPGYEMRLCSSFGRVVLLDHEPGELQVRYHGMMIGYKDQSPLEEGAWFATGDIMSRIDGKYYVAGRSKELIKVNGWQVPPAEIEAVLMTHPCISDAGVIGTLREDGVTEAPRAFIVRKVKGDGRISTVSEEEICEFVKARLASYKSLYKVNFIESIPKTASGKIQRFELARIGNCCDGTTEAPCA